MKKGVYGIFKLLNIPYKNIMIEIRFDKEKKRAVAYDNTIQVGECDFLETEDYWNITHTEVNGNYQGQGIARKLVECIIENAKKEKKNEIILFENQGVKLEVNLKDETVWLTQAQMEELFDVKHATISEHISNIFKEGELEERTSVGISDKSTGGRKSKIYNLDVIISVGYRVKSKNGVIFRKWATKILKDYMLKGYAVNQKRLEYLEKTIKLIDIANRMEDRLENNDAKEILKVIGDYSKALDLLDDYDHLLYS